MERKWIKNKILFEYDTKSHSEKTDKIYKGQNELVINDKEYKIYFEINESISIDKMHIRIKKIHLNDKSITYSNLLKLLPFLIPYINKIEKWVLSNLNFFLKNENCFIEKNENFSLLPIKLSNEDVENILSIKENGNKILNSTYIKRIKSFISNWENLIKNDSKEQLFQKEIENHKDIIPLLLPNIGFLSKVEFLIDSNGEQKNRGDVLFNNKNLKTIIELKKPNTKLFNKSNSRNNISGMSSDFISAMIQLLLYNKQMILNSSLIKDSFFESILIIGHNNQIDNDEKKTSWMIIKEKFKGIIYTFDDILKIAKNLLKFFENSN